VFNIKFLVNFEFCPKIKGNSYKKEEEEEKLLESLYWLEKKVVKKK